MKYNNYKIENLLYVQVDSQICQDRIQVMSRVDSQIDHQIWNQVRRQVTKDVFPVKMLICEQMNEKEY